MQQTMLEYMDAPRRSFVTTKFLADCPPAVVERTAESLELPSHSNLWTEQDRVAILLEILESEPAVRESLGIIRAEIPADIHAVAPGATMGDFRASNLIVDTLDEAGLTPVAGDRVLDFGASSGRVVRTLAAYRPDVEWMGCDPRKETIEWAKSSFPAVSWFISDPTPPLPNVDTNSLAGTFAISIWSHFSEQRALEWLAEMHRVTRPGGWLLLSTHGLRSVHHQWRLKKGMRETRASKIASQLSRPEAAYVFSAYPSDNLDPDLEGGHWGLSFANEQWWSAVPGWQLKQLRRGRLLANQDVYLLVAQ